MLMLLREVSLF